MKAHHKLTVIIALSILSSVILKPMDWVQGQDGPLTISTYPISVIPTPEVWTQSEASRTPLSPSKLCIGQKQVVVYHYVIEYDLPISNLYIPALAAPKPNRVLWSTIPVYANDYWIWWEGIATGTFDVTFAIEFTPDTPSWYTGRWLQYQLCDGVNPCTWERFGHTKPDFFIVNRCTFLPYLVN